MKKIIGFTAGAFDMFHVGHLNLLKNARARCDYLIAGVNTDDLIAAYKNKHAIVSLEERMQIVGAVKYVDEVIAVDTLDKEVIWEKKKFDIVFIGDDWKGSERWNETEQVMKEHNVEVVYLPYTVGTTSTVLREKLLML
jgi:glycerol-3-phosphate cytidylyltransferase